MMSHKQFQDWVTNGVFIVTLSDIFFLIGPGIAVIYQFKPVMIVSLDWVKLTLLALAVTVPFSVINTAIALDVLDLDPNKKQSLFTGFSSGIIMTGMMLYVILGLAYFFSKPFFQCALFLILIELSAMAWVDIRGRSKDRQNHTVAGDIP
jgi:hypothetical protein